MVLRVLLALIVVAALPQAMVELAMSVVPIRLLLSPTCLTNIRRIQLELAPRPSTCSAATTPLHGAHGRSAGTAAPKRSWGLRAHHTETL